MTSLLLRLPSARVLNQSCFSVRSDSSKMVLGERWVIKNKFDGLPKPDDFELVKEELEPLEVMNWTDTLCILTTSFLEGRS